MKISSRCDYAIRALIHLAALEHLKPYIHIEEIAEKQNIPIKFLAIILLQLKKLDLVSSKKGPNGGYSLKCNPSDLSFYAIVEMVDGKLNEYNINFSKNTTNESLNAAAVVKDNLDKIQKAAIATAKNFTLRSMVNGYAKLQGEDDDYEI